MKHLSLIILLILFATTIFFIEQRIQAYDMRFYYGKDNGLFARFESICVMSSIFFIFLSRGKKIISGIIGLIAGVISSILSAYITFFILNIWIEKSDLAFHIISVVLFIILFYLREYYLKNKK